MSDARRIVVTLNVRDDNGVDHEWSLVLPDAIETVTDAIDAALKNCPDEIRGLESVETLARDVEVGPDGGEQDARRD